MKEIKLLTLITASVSSDKISVKSITLPVVREVPNYLRVDNGSKKGKLIYKKDLGTNTTKMRTDIYRFLSFSCWVIPSRAEAKKKEILKQFREELQTRWATTVAMIEHVNQEISENEN